MRALLPFLFVLCGCATMAPRDDVAVSSNSDPTLDSADALAAKLTYSAVQRRAIGATTRYFIRDVRFTKDALSFMAYAVSESPGGSSLERSEWLVPYASLRESTFEIGGENTVHNRYGELRITCEKKDAFRRSTELSTASFPLGPGPHTKHSRDIGAESKLTLMFSSRGRAEEFRDALLAALNKQTPNKAPEPTP